VEPKLKIMMIIMVMIIGYESESVWWGGSQGGIEGKERILIGEEGQNTLYVQKQHNETHQTLFEKWERREGDMGI
jgi:hypothetical protein